MNKQTHTHTHTHTHTSPREREREIMNDMMKPPSSPRSSSGGGGGGRGASATTATTAANASSSSSNSNTSSKLLETFFQRQKLYGREKEIARLRASFWKKPTTTHNNNNSNNHNDSVSIYFVHGDSGCGKTKLIETAFFRKQQQQQANSTFSSSSSSSGSSPSSYGNGGSSGSSTCCLFGCGKFEQTPDPTPYGFLLQALRQIVQDLIKGSSGRSGTSTDRRMYSNILKQSFNDDELARLVAFIPELTTFLYDGGEEEDESGNGSHGTTKNVRDDGPFRVSSKTRRYSTDEGAQVKYIIRTFLKKMATHNDRPIVLYLDDVQWIDDLTLSVVQSIFLDNELKNVIFVASFRTTEVYNYGKDDIEIDGGNTTTTFDQEKENIEVDQKHKVVKLIETLKSGCHGSNVEEMVVKNMDVDSIHLLLQDVLKTDDDGTYELATLLVERTNGGNAYYLLELLAHLEKEGLVTSSTMDNRWTWDLETIRNETSVTSDMADILKGRIVKLSFHEQEILKHCACLGFRFQECLLPEVLKATSAVIDRYKNHPAGRFDSSNVDDLHSIADSLVNQRLLERVGKYLKFAHDKVFEATLQLADNAERARIHWNLGLELYSRFFGSNVDLTTSSAENTDTWKEYVFLCVNRFNSGIEANGGKHSNLNEDLLKLNQLAARRAADLSAFDDAFVYAKNAMDLLSHIEDSWSTQYNLSLSVHSLYLQMCHCSTSGKEGDLEGTFHLIQKNSKTIEDSMDASLVLLSYYAFTTRFEDMLQTANEIFDVVGESMPRNPSKNEARQEFKKIAKLFNEITDEEILEGLPSISDHPLKEYCLRAMDTICYPLNHAGKRNFQL